MGTLIEDIKTGSEWLVKAFEADGLQLDYSIQSTMEIDRFFIRNMKDGKPKRRGRLASNYGFVLFSIGAYLGETIIKNVPGTSWTTNDEDPEGEVNIQLNLPDGATIWPVQKVGKRFQLGKEEAIYPYVAMTLSRYTGETFDESFWQITREEEARPDKPWWKFW